MGRLGSIEVTVWVVLIVLRGVQFCVFAMLDRECKSVGGWWVAKKKLEAVGQFHFVQMTLC
jgi:hypothetical protein